MRRIASIETVILRDDDPDLSYLQTTFENIEHEEQGLGVRVIHSCRYNSGTYFGAEGKKIFGWITEDTRRLRAYGRTWWCVGILKRAKIEITHPDTGGIIQHISIKTPGLWGIESDAGEEYFREVEEEEARELRTILMELGFTSDEIYGAEGCKT